LNPQSEFRIPQSAPHAKRKNTLKKFDRPI
jgi:hypothetical protein